MIHFAWVFIRVVIMLVFALFALCGVAAGARGNGQDGDATLVLLFASAAILIAWSLT